MYKLLSSTSTGVLSREVRDHLNEGWALHGDPIVIIIPERSDNPYAKTPMMIPCYYQAVTKPSDNGGEKC